MMSRDRKRGAFGPFPLYSIVLRWCCCCCCLMLTVGQCAGADPRTGSDDNDGGGAPETQCGGSGTYYIHEYHVHGGDAATGSRPFVESFAGRQAIGDVSGTYNRTLYLEEKTTWLERFRDLSERLADERSRRLEMIARLVAWLSSVERSHPTDARLGSLRNMLLVWSDRAPSNDSRTPTSEDDPEWPAPNATTTSEQLRSGAEVRSPPCSTACNATELDNLSAVIAGQTAELAEAKNEIQRLHKRYLTTYSGYRKMVANVRELKRDLRSWEHRAGRLLRLYESQFDPGDKTRKGNVISGQDSGALIDDVKALKRRVWCLERGEADPLLCPNVKPAIKQDPPKRTPPSNDEHVTTNRGGVEYVDSLMTSNVSRLLQDSFLDAGKELSEWHQTKIRRQKPKDCSEIDYWFQRREPVQTIYLEDGRRAVKALCEEGWNVIMKNIPYGSNPVDLDRSSDRTWQHYKYGFGRFESDVFWFGNEYLYWLTNQADYQLRIDMTQTADNEHVYAEYAFFRLAPEADGYRLAVGDNSGSAGDVLGVHSPVPVDRQRFATVDRHPEPMDNRLKFYRHGWWYPTVDVRHDPDGRPHPCFTHLTHEYPWICGRNGYQQLSSVTMKIRPLRDGL